MRPLNLVFSDVFPKSAIASALCKAGFAVALLATTCLLAMPICQATEPASANSNRVPAVKLQSITAAEQPDSRLANTGVDVSSDPALNNPALLDYLNGFLGKPLTRQALLDILNAINAYLAVSGNAFTVASLPKQDLSDGRLRVLITRGRVGQINIRNVGKNTFTENYYRQLLRLKPGNVLVRDTLDGDVEWINRSNPYRNARVMTMPGKEIGQTDVELQVNEQRPYAFSAAYDNSGTARTGQDRITLSAGWGQVFGTDQQLSYTLNANPSFENYVSHSLNYVVPLPWRHLLSISANHTKIKSKMPQPFDSTGSSDQVSVRYDILLKSLGTYSHDVNLGFDHKRSDNNLLFSQTPVTNTLTRIYQFNLGYSGTLLDRHGQTTVGLNWTHSPGGVDNSNSDTAFNAARAGATARYNYQVLDIARITRLPADWTWTIHGRFQRSDSNLLGSEQLSGGGVNSVRAFSEAIAFGDEGHVIRTELQTPIKGFVSGSTPIQMQGLLFYDDARLNNKHLLPGEAASSHLSAWGVGVRATVAQSLSIRMDAGKQIDTVAGVSATNLVHVSISKSF